MPWFEYFKRPILTRSGTVMPPITTGPTTGTDLLVGQIHTLVTSSDAGYYRIDPPTRPGLWLQFIRAGTTATTSYLIPDATGVNIHTSSGSTEGRLITLSGGATVELLAQTTAAWLIANSRGNVACSSST